MPSTLFSLPAVLILALLVPGIAGRTDVAASGPASTYSQPIASYNLAPLPFKGAGACQYAADATRAVVGIPWGGSSPVTGNFDYGCRGFRLISLRTGISRTVVQLPASEQRAQWAVDEPHLVGKWLVYEHGIALVDRDWKIEALNLVTGQTRTLDRHHAGPIPLADDGPLVTASGQNVVWTKGSQKPDGKIIYRVHSYSLKTGKNRVVATGGPVDRASKTAQVLPFIDARIDGSTLVFLRGLPGRMNIWVQDLRTGRARALTHTGKVGPPVITGPWIAWSVLGKGYVGPLMVADLRTGVIRMVDKQATISASAGSGRLTWFEDVADKSMILDLVTGQMGQIPNISAQQAHPSLSSVQGRVLIETASTNTNGTVFLKRVLVYAKRPVPGVPMS